MAVKTTLHLQNSVVARRQDWRRKLVLLGWSYRLTFPLEGIFGVITLSNNKKRYRIIMIIIIDVVDIFFLLFKRFVIPGMHY